MCRGCWCKTTSTLREGPCEPSVPDCPSWSPRSEVLLRRSSRVPTLNDAWARGRVSTPLSGGLDIGIGDDLASYSPSSDFSACW